MPVALLALDCRSSAAHMHHHPRPTLTDGCKWEGGDCSTDSDCSKYNTSSLKNPAGGKGNEKHVTCPMSGGPKWAHQACACEHLPTSITFTLPGVGSGWNLISVKASCDFDPLGSAVTDCHTSLTTDCASPIGHSDWTEAIWVFGNDTNTPWMKFTKDGTTKNSALAQLLTDGVPSGGAHGAGSGFTSSYSGFSGGVISSLYFMRNLYITQVWSASPRLLSLFTSGDDTTRKCIGGVCRGCATDPVWFLVK